MTVKLLTEHHLEFLGLKGGCTGSSEPTLVKMSHCRKSHVTAHITYAQRHALNSHADVSREAGCLNFGLSLRLSLGMRAVKALASLRLCADSPEPSVLDNIAVYYQNRISRLVVRYDNFFFDSAQVIPSIKCIYLIHTYLYDSSMYVYLMNMLVRA